VDADYFMPPNDNRDSGDWYDLYERAVRGELVPSPAIAAVPEDSERVLLGLDYSQLGDEETGAQFKKRAEGLILSALPPKAKVQFRFINEEVYS